jgi:ABC-type multidrug transport system fused ATPase/permease subunit
MDRVYVQRAVRAMALLNRKEVIWVVCLTVFSSAMMAAEPMVWKTLLDTLMSREPLFRLSLQGSILAIAASLLLLNVFKEGLTRVCFWLCWRIRVSLETGLVGKCSAALFQSSLDYHEDTSTGKIAEKIRRGINGLLPIVYDMVTSLLPSILYVIGTVVLMAMMNGVLAVIACTFAAIPALLGAWMGGVKARREEEVMDHWQRIWTRFYNGLWLIKLVKSFSRERSEDKRFIDDLRKTDQFVLDGIKLEAWVEFAKNVSVGLGKAIIVGYGGFLVLEGRISIGALAAFYAFCHGLFQPMLTIATMIESLRRSGVYLQVLFELIDAPNSVKEAPDARTLPEVQGVLRFDSVTVQRGADKVLDNVSLTAHPGQLLAIAGAFGSGKSTLIGCAMRFVDPDQGSVSLDGCNVKNLTLDWLRGTAVGLVQDTELWKGSILENILFGRPDATFEEVVAAARAGGAHDFISKKAEGYEFDVGSAGIRLSSGERQLVALARLLLANPQVIILDEVTSHLDALTEDLVRTAIDSLVAQGKTVIVIAHRLSSIRNAHRILVMHGGKVVDEGTHGELMARDGMYADFVAKQALANGPPCE